MTRIVEDRPGQILALKGSDCDLSINSQRGELVFERHALIMRSGPRIFRLDELVDLRLRVSEWPALTTAIVGKIMGAAFQAVRDGQDKENIDTQGLSAGSARQLLLRIRTRNDRGDIESVEERLSVESVVDFAGAVELVGKMKAASGLGAVDLYALPECGIELLIRAGKESSASEPSLPEDLDLVPPSPFEASDFESEHRVEEWSPGEKVRLRKPLSKMSPFFLLLSLVCLTVFALFLYRVVTGDPSSRGVFLIIAAFGLVCGGGIGFVTSGLLPRAVVFDWGAREIRVETWFRKRVVPFAEIDRLELEAKKTATGGGESGAGTTRYVAVLRAVHRNQGGEDLDALGLVETKNLRHDDEPLWMALPLLYELTNELEVKAKFINYNFRSESK